MPSPAGPRTTRWLQLTALSLGIAAAQGAATLRFDPENSPPPRGSTRADLVKAYNRPAFSSVHRRVRVFVEDSDTGGRITTGPDSTIEVTLDAAHLFASALNPAAAATALAAAPADVQAAWSNLNYSLETSWDSGALPPVPLQLAPLLNARGQISRTFSAPGGAMCGGR